MTTLQIHMAIAVGSNFTTFRRSTGDEEPSMAFALHPENQKRGAFPHARLQLGTGVSA
jgi:hypothetical protein